MRTFTGTDPAQFIANFFESFTADLVNTDEDAARIVDRFHTPDVVQIADGQRIDRDTLIAHARLGTKDTANVSSRRSRGVRTQ